MSESAVGGIRGLRRRPVAATGLVVLLGLVLVVAVSVFRQATRDPNQGLQTTCRDYLKMTGPQRVAVWERAGMSPADATHQLDVTGVVTDCAQAATGDKTMTISDGPASYSAQRVHLSEPLSVVTAALLGLVVLLGVGIWDASRRPA